ncbi:MAG: DUF3738 domain-containing protein [Acidimicrobiia bacterium]|nr:DUF3738 domain-containing protein [Acidimicrobiia bacterium]
MLRALGAERFRLTVHNETRELPIYALVPSRDDRWQGPNLKPSTVDCAAEMAAMRERRAAGSPPPPPPTPPAPCETPRCGMSRGARDRPRRAADGMKH